MKIVCSFIFFLLFFPCYSSLLADELDSLTNILNTTKPDTSRVNTLNQISQKYQRIDLDSSLQFAVMASELAKKIDYMKGMADAAHCTGIVYAMWGDLDTCLIYWLKNLDIRNEMRDSVGASKVYGNIGIIYKNIGNFDKAIEYFQKGLTELYKNNDKVNISNTLNSLGSIHDDINNHQKAIDYFMEALKIKEELGQEREIAGIYSNMGVVYKNMKNSEEAYRCYLKALEILTKLNDRRGLSVIYTNIGIHHSFIREYDKAIEYYELALSIKEELGDKVGISVIITNLAEMYIGLADSSALSGDQATYYYAKAKKYSERSLKLAEETGSLVRYRAACGALYLSLKKLGMFEKSLEYAELYMETNDSLLSQDKAKVLAEMEGKYQSERKQLEIEKLGKEKELQEEIIIRKEVENKKQQNVILSFIVGLIMIVFFSIVLTRLFLQKRKANVKLSLKNEEICQKNEEITSQRDEIETQRDILATQNEDIESSINYAKRIQQAVLPTEKMADLLLGEHFIFFRPKDIVSGDFYWTTKVNEYLIVTVADCTGHGVPGAFMSMLGVSFLNEIVRKKEVTNASDVLNQLRDAIIEALRQTGEQGSAKDGMDMSLCVLTNKNRSLQWAGANNPLWIVRSPKNLTGFQNLSGLGDNGEIVEFKADKMPVAVHVKMESFTNHEIELQCGDTVYLFSDGFPDQFGGEKRKKFMYKPFKNLLMMNSNKPMKEQCEILEATLDHWMNYEGKVYEQIDDITVVGMRV